MTVGPKRTVEHKVLRGAITQRYPGLFWVLLNFLKLVCVDQMAVLWAEGEDIEKRLKVCN